MTTQCYIAFFAINPYGSEVPACAIDAADQALKDHLGCAYQVLAAKDAFEQAGGLHAYWRELCPPDIARWTRASAAAVEAAYRASWPAQSDIDDCEPLKAAFIDVIAAARYVYSEDEWLTAFTAHFGMSDYCGSYQEAVNTGRRWLAVAPDACPIAAAEQEIRYRSPRAAREYTQSGGFITSPLRSANVDTLGARTCF